MKKTLICASFLVAGLFGQGRLTAIGGANYSTIVYNNPDFGNAANVKTKPGFFLGVESNHNPTVLGAAYAQYGAEFSMADSSESFIGSDTYNYLVGYVFYPFIHTGGFSAFGGVQTGLSLGGNIRGKISDTSITGHMKADKFTFDYGLIAGINFTVAPQYGFRAFYYYGLADVLDLTASDQNFKNRGFGLLLMLTP